MASSMLHVRLDDELKEQASRTLEAMGLSVSDAVRVFLVRVIADQALPFDLKVPNAETRAAMQEAARTLEQGQARFASADALFADLDAGGDR